MRRRHSLLLAGLVSFVHFGCSQGGEPHGEPRGNGQGPGGQSPGSGGQASAGNQAGGSVANGGSAPVQGGSSAAAGATAGGQDSGQGSGGAPVSPSSTPVVFVGGFGEAPVIQYDLNPATGALTQRAMFDAGPEPSCFAVDPARQHLFVGNEADSEQGGIISYALNADGSASFINHRAATDSGFTSLTVHPSGKFIAGASYGGGSTSVFPIAADGSVGAQAGSADFGSDAMSHCVAYDPSGQHLLVATKGTDAVQQLLQTEAGTLTPNAPPHVPAASGPRHLAVHPNGKLVFVVAENGSALTSYQLSSDGKLTETAEISSLPGDYEGNNTGAHVELSADGHILYVSNRGHDSIGVFSVDEASGALTLIEFEPARGNNPHDFDIDQTGQILIAANRRSATLTVFKIAADGSLSALGEPVPTREDPTGVLIHYPQ